MIQGTASSLIPPSFGFESRARSGAQTSKPTGSGFRSDSSASAALGQASQLTPEQQQQVQQLKQTDRKVRAHEQAHLSVGADLVRGGATFSYTTGPDNKRYAVAGEVSIDSSPARTPKETIPKAQHIRATALAPADPSAQDQSVAAQASRMESDARVELAVQQREDATSTDQGSTRFYRGVEQSNGNNAQVGGRLDFFA